MYKVQIDTMDAAYTQQAAQQAGLKATIVLQDGPAGWPVVELVGNKQALTKHLVDGHYDLDAHQLIKA